MKLLAFIYSLIFLLNTPWTVSGCHEDERAALLSFKSQLEDPSDQLSTWKGLNCCSWHGIRCSNSLHVVTVNLRNPSPTTFFINMNSELLPTKNSTSTALQGRISPSLFTLTHLRHLDLSFNNFMSSKIPAGIANLTGLTYLNLSNTMLRDSITTQFANLTSLKWFDLSCSSVVTDYSSLSFDLSSTKMVQDGAVYSYINRGNLWTESLDWLSKLRDIRVLKLSGVDLFAATISSEWAKPFSFLPNINSLVLSHCRISSNVPIDQLLNLTQLSELMMDFNPLTFHIPAQLANLTSLEVLDLSSSNLEGGIPYLPNLKKLYVGNSSLTIDLQEMFSAHWPRLEILDIGNTQVEGSIPPSIANTSTLISFFASQCSIQGSIPSSISNLSRLEFLELNSNNLVGNIPPSISTIQSLEYLSVMQNSLEGPIPESLCNISSLWGLLLAANKLSGNFPACIGRLPNLQYLYVSSNSLTGEIQSLSSFFQSTRLYMIGFRATNITVKLGRQPFSPSFQPSILELSSCNMEGKLEDILSSLTQITYLDLANNSLSGTIPSWMFNLSGLGYLDLSNNKLQGFLPSQIQMNSYFGPTTINLANNLLQGSIPSMLQNVDVINLSGNNFTGEIAPQMGLGITRYLSVSGNKLSGHIPQSFCPENSPLMLLDLSNNNLSGVLPDSLGNCTFLSYLNIAKNNLTGQVPNSLMNVRNLSYLDFTDNNFEGPFPTFIRKHKYLAAIQMGNNNFGGNIPWFIGELQNLRILILRSNFFNGSIPAEISSLEKLQVIDFSNNRLSGPIPEKLNGLKTLITRPTDGDLLGYIISSMYAGVQLSMAYKGLIYQFEVVRTYLSGVDLSLNNLSGNIPSEIVLLKGLAMLNLSHNGFSSELPSNIGEMTGLNSLDLSFNNLRGEIPSSINLLDSLGTLNLSYNNFTGKIPSGTRFDTFDGSVYLGNRYLCGSPDAIISCSNESSNSNNASTSDQENDSTENSWETALFSGVVAIGFGFGILGHYGFLCLLNEQWRQSYWLIIDKIVSRITHFGLWRKRRTRA